VGRFSGGCSGAARRRRGGAVVRRGGRVLVAVIGRLGALQEGHGGFAGGFGGWGGFDVGRVVGEADDGFGGGEAAELGEGDGLGVGGEDAGAGLGDLAEEVGGARGPRVRDEAVEGVESERVEAAEVADVDRGIEEVEEEFAGAEVVGEGRAVGGSGRRRRVRGRVHARIVQRRRRGGKRGVGRDAKLRTEVIGRDEETRGLKSGGEEARVGDAEVGEGLESSLSSLGARPLPRCATVFIDRASRRGWRPSRATIVARGVAFAPTEVTRRRRRRRASRNRVRSRRADARPDAVSAARRPSRPADR